MSLGLGVDLRNARLQVVADRLDAQATVGRLLIYKGTQPATGGEPGPNDLLADLPLARPPGTVTDGVLTFTLPPDTNAVESGEPTWARMQDAAGNNRIDGDVGVTGSDAFVEMSEDTGNPGHPEQLVAGGLVIVNSASLTEGNP